MTNPIYHNHHIVPRHAGGSNHSSNLIRLTIPEHAEAHRLLWEQHGRLQDKLAWLMLSGKTEEAELARIELSRQAGRRRKGSKLSEETKRKMSLARTGLKRTAEQRQRMSAGQTGRIVTQTHRERISAASKGKPKPFSENHRRAIAESRKGKTHSPEAKAKMSLSKIKYYAERRLHT